MKKYFYALACAAGVLLTSCNSKKQTVAENVTPKHLILYYSESGTTESLAKTLKEYLVDADMERIEAVEPYDKAFDNIVKRGKKELDEGILPEIKPLKSDISKYDTIFLGYPVWFGTYAVPVKTLLSQVNLAGKTIVPFCTFGSGGLESSVKDIKAAQPDAIVKDGYGLRQARLNSRSKELRRFLIEQGYMEGTVETLPEYSEQHQLNRVEELYLTEATSGYQFPLGTPLSVGTRQTADGVDYKYIVKSKDIMTGGDAKTTIYVTKEYSAAKAEFTRVVR
jgi:flavodoxin